jgi:alpha-tubulin suppressor-like RCC1 family protein
MEGNIPQGPIAQVAVSIHACAVKRDGTVACWGYNDCGQSTAPGERFVQVSHENHWTCWRSAAGQVSCWGDPQFGQVPTPTETFTQVSVGDDATCGIRPDGSVLCWAQGGNPVTETPSGKFDQVDVGRRLACGIRTDGALLCWGDPTATPVGNFTRVGVGDDSACAIRSDGSATCWANSGSGLGTSLAGNYTQVSAADNPRYACALTNTGAIRCWGDSPPNPPTGEFTQVSVRGDSACALRKDKSIACWAWPGREVSPPNDPDGFAQLSAGFLAVYAVSTTGRQWCWGAIVRQPL